VKILLDTQRWLWMQVTPERLSQRTLELLRDPDNELYLSAASSWEIAIKFALGKLALPEPPSTYVPSRMANSGVLGLPVEHSHALQVAALPRHHRDPFDRLLIAQAQLEHLPILTSDRQFTPYEVEIRWATVD
jgi:PIN domain nuclease of toxin-antitoxin system